MPCNYKHKKGFGGAGGSPVSFRKREGTIEDKRVIHGMSNVQFVEKQQMQAKNDPSAEMTGAGMNT